MGGGKKHKVNGTGKALGQSKLKQRKSTKQQKNASTLSRYFTRNECLNKLQLKLADFRRLCILKGIHPREPKKKVKGQGKTYYHAKDVQFLMHEPLMNTFRELRAYERNIKRAKGKKHYNQVDRLRENKPRYKLDHLVKERYPTFGDALRDLDDCLTLVNLFALLPADKRLGIPMDSVIRARELSLEFQSYVTRKHALRKVFISVKGFYYEAEIHGQTVIWLVSHNMQQTLPEDVDYRVMLTFLEFYTAMIAFVNHQLYHEDNLRYPPVLDVSLEDAATGAVAIVHELKKKVQNAAMVARANQMIANGSNALEQREANNNDNNEGLVAEEKKKMRKKSLAEKLKEIAHFEDGEDDEDVAEREAAEREQERENEKMRMEEDIEMMTTGDEANAQMATTITDDERNANLSDRELFVLDRKRRAGLFNGLTFLIKRECPREAMVFIIKSFGGEVCWEGEGSPIDCETEKDKITHVIIDRPLPNDTKPSEEIQREFIVPQWVCDCANFRVLIPTEKYFPGKQPPPHLSPFVDPEEEGYYPEYLIEMMKLQQAMGVPGRQTLPASALSKKKKSKKTEEDEEEDLHRKELEKELQGVPYSKSLTEREKIDDDDDEEEEDNSDSDSYPGEEGESEDSDPDESSSDEDDSDDDDDDDDNQQKQKQKMKSKLTPDMAMREKDKIVRDRVTKGGEQAELDHLKSAMLPRKKRELYKAMQIGIAKKEKRAEELRERAKALKEQARSKGGNKRVKTTKGAKGAPANKKAKK
jgi:pescadillo